MLFRNASFHVDANDSEPPQWGTVLTEQQWRELSDLIDRALEVEPAERAQWVDALGGAHAELKPILARMIHRAASADSTAFLCTLPKIRTFAGEPSDGSAGPTIGYRIGPYRLVRELGNGGMAVVWLAERSDALVTRKVALKLPQTTVDRPDIADRFAREREILASLNHPNIARLYDVGLAEGRPYLAMEYVEGRPIVEYCDSRCLALRDRIVLFQNVLAAVQYAHCRLVVHRDIKPSNILVSEEGGVRLLDFGIAKLLVDGRADETELTQISGRALTPSYASPEQISGAPVAPTSDIYSLAVVLYELLAGTMPYRLKRVSRGALEDAIVASDPKLASQGVTDDAAVVRATTRARLARALRGDLDTILGKALKKAPTERYGSVQEFMQDLQRYLDGRPVLARRDSAWYRLMKFIGRNPLPVGAACAIGAAALLLALTQTAATIIALSVGLAAALWQARRAERHARSATSEAQRALSEMRTAQAVQGFLRDIFRANSSAQPDPLKARQTTARELLDIGAAKIGSALDDAPDAKVQVLATLASLYRDLSVPEREQLLQAERASLARSIYGASDPRLAEALLDRATALSLAEGALPLLEESLAILDSKPGQTSPTRGRLMTAFCNYYAVRDRRRALHFAEEAVRILREGPASIDLQRALVALGNEYRLLSRYDEGEAVMLEAVDVANALRPQSNALLPDLYSLLGNCQEASQAFARADASFQRSLDAATALYGPDDIGAIVAEFRLAALTCRGEPARGIVRLEHVLQRIEQLPHADPPRRLLVLRGCIRPLLDFGRIEQACEIAGDCVTQYRKRYAGSWPLAVSVDLLAAVELELGHYEAAELLLQEAEAIHDAVQTGIELRIEHQTTLARLFAVTARLGAAEQLLDVFMPLPLDGARLPPGSLEATVARGALALARGNAELAAKLAVDARAAIAKHPSPRHFMTWETRATALEGEAWLAAGCLDRALPLLHKARDLAQSVYDVDLSLSLAAIYIVLARCKIALGMPLDAQAFLRPAQYIQSRHGALGAHYAKPMEDVQHEMARASHTRG